MKKDMIYKVVPVIDYKVRDLCRRPYRGHPKGCPNYNQSIQCPPRVGYFDQIFDLKYPVFAIVNRFNFKEHVEKMKHSHPTWSKYQLECCLYWQPKARKELRDLIYKFRERIPAGYGVATIPEAMGINVTETMRSIGIELEWPPVNFTYQVALAGYLKGGRQND